MRRQMKKLLILLIPVLFSFSAEAQEHRDLEEFKGDPIAYIKYNFVENQDRYIGQPLKKLVMDYDENLLFRTGFRYTTYWAPGSEGKRRLEGVSIFYLYPNEMDQYKEAGKPYVYLIINFTHPHPEYQTIYELMPKKDDDRQWAMNYGDLIIERIRLEERNHE